MEKVLIIGPFNETMKKALENALADDFELSFITRRDEYGRLAEGNTQLQFLLRRKGVGVIVEDFRAECLAQSRYPAADIADADDSHRLTADGVGFCSVSFTLPLALLHSHGKRHHIAVGGQHQRNSHLRYRNRIDPVTYRYRDFFLCGGLNIHRIITCTPALNELDLLHCRNIGGIEI